MSAPQGPAGRTCAQMVVHEWLAEIRPEYRERRLEAETQTRACIRSGEAMRVVEELITLPVVVHIVYGAPEENISDAQVKSQIKVLNRDYRVKNPDKRNTPVVWKGLLTDAKIEFALATKDPDGKPTTGITRTATTAESFGVDDGVKSSAKGGVDPWPTDRFLNLWVCGLANGVLGYSQFPGGPAATDGVVIQYTAFGTQGTVRPPFNLGRTTTHEVAHFLGLRHIWGDRNDGTGDDFVTDTPPARQANKGKPRFPNISMDNGPSGDMFMNFMDYVDDDTMCMFTAGQVARMNATLAGPRQKLAGL